MLQYGHADFEQKGYQLVSANPFFQDKDRAEQLAPLMHYVMNPSPAYRDRRQVTYTGLFTDLGYRTEAPRYYIQAAGPTFFRNGSYVHGYAQQGDEEGFFAENFLQLLRARFYDAAAMNSIPAADSASRFPDLDAPPVDPTLTPAPMDPALLAAVVEQLLRQNRVLLRLDREGDEAPRYARQVLLRIYACLPYGARKFCGFVTNVPMSRVVDPAKGDELPTAVKLVLVDGDACLPAQLPGFAVFDMRAPAPAPSPREDTARFLQFLVREDNEAERTRFFGLVHRAMEMVSGERSVSLYTYQDIFSMQALIDRPVTTEAVHLWANWLGRNQGGVASSLRQQFLTLLSARLSADEILGWLTGPEGRAELPALEQIARLWRAEPVPEGSGAACPAAVLALFEAVSRSDDILRIGGALADWYCEQALARVQPYMLRVGEESLPTPAAIERAGQLQKMAMPESAAAIRNQIALVAARGLRDRLARAGEQLRALYTERLADERARAARLLDDCAPATYAALCDFYTSLPAAFPLCANRMETQIRANRQENAFADAFGDEMVQKLRRCAELRPMPAAADELDPFLRDWSVLRTSALARTGLLAGLQQRLRPVLDAAAALFKARQDTSTAARLRLLAQLQDGTFQALGTPLLADLRRTVRTELAEQPPCTPAQLPGLLPALLAVAKTEPDLAARLSQPLWTVQTTAPAALAPLEASAELWGRLSAALGKKVTVRFADGAQQELAVPDALAWLLWAQNRCGQNVPAPVLACARQTPVRAIRETPSSAQLRLLAQAFGARERPAFLRCLVQTTAVDDYSFAKQAVTQLRQAGLRGQDLLRTAAPGWDTVIFAVYSDPLAGPQGETLRRLQQALPQLHKRMSACAHRLDKAAAQRRRLVRGTFAAAICAASVLPMVLLWAFGAAGLAACALVLAALAVQAAVVVGCVLRLAGDGGPDRQEKSCLALYLLGLTPGCVLALAGMLLALL